jgi:hypothetical protein
VDPLPAGCTTPNEPLKNPEKCLVDSFGAFVSPTGDDGNPGTKAKPFKTIGKALAGEKTRIAVCEGTYKGSVTIGRKVEIYGGVDCDFKGPGAKAKIEASEPGFAVKLTQANETLLSDLSLVGKNGVQPGESSIGLFVSESTNVKLVRLTVEAGEGAEAGPVKNGLFVFPTQTNLDAQGAVPGSTGTCPGGGKSVGGAGGAAGNDGMAGDPAPPGGLAGTISACQLESKGGQIGAAGTPGTTMPGASTTGALSSSGWQGTAGGTGGNGAPGGGGGGGGGYQGTGGAGGAGGCGGEGGKGGGPGGSSIAVASYKAAIQFSEVMLTAKTAKPGGAGGDGQAGQGGGTKGNGTGNACQGAPGVQGGAGGHGGGGAGGLSVGILWSGGSAPSKDGLTTINRATGPGVSGGPNGGGGTGKGASGVNEDIYELK